MSALCRSQSVVTFFRAWAVVCSLAGLSNAVELNANSGFENLSGSAEAPFAEWGYYGGFENGKYAIGISGEARAGQHACRITCLRKGRAGLASAKIPLAAGSLIEVSCWIKASGADAGRVFLNFEGDPGDGWAAKDLKTGTYGWMQFKHRAVVPAGKTEGPQSIVVRLYTTCEGVILVDDFSIRTVEAEEESTGPPATKMPDVPPLPADPRGYRVAVVPPLEKIFPDDGFAPPTSPEVVLSAARNEYESVQLAVEAPWRSVDIGAIEFSDFEGPGGAVIPASAAGWRRVDYVRTTVEPPYYTDRGPGSYPDPLMPAGPFHVPEHSRVPIWITVRTPESCVSGEYTGTITVVPRNGGRTGIPVKWTVWDFGLTDETHLRTLTWLNHDVLRQWYQPEESPEGRAKQAEVVRNYQDFLLEHRLGPGGNAADQVPAGEDGQFDFRGVDLTLRRLIDRGMNAFIMGTAPNLHRTGQTAYTPEFTGKFTGMLKAYSDHLRDQGWLNRAYVYVYDEAPRRAWPEVKKIAEAIHSAVPEARILQCLNEPEGVAELTGFADVFDVYVAQYHRSGVAKSQEKGAEVWLSVCAYPMDHPNFFLEYPLLDLRVAPWICWKYQAAGFEYWSVNSWGSNVKKQGAQWPESSWTANTFGNYNGDGYLIYPGPDLKPCSSIRFESLRDGFEDYEYLWTLNSLLLQAAQRKLEGAEVEAARALLALDGLVKPTGSYSSDPAEYLVHRRKIAEAIIGLGRMLSP